MVVFDVFVREACRDGRLGEVLHREHPERVNLLGFPHSFVRDCKKVVELDVATLGLDALGEPTRMPIGLMDPEEAPDLDGDNMVGIR